MRDNLCKYLAETYPTAFTQWLLNDASEDVSILKTELNLEPIRADSVTLMQTQNCILHLGLFLSYDLIKGFDSLERRLILNLLSET